MWADYLKFSQNNNILMWGCSLEHDNMNEVTSVDGNLGWTKSQSIVFGWIKFYYPSILVIVSEASTDNHSYIFHDSIPTNHLQKDRLLMWCLWGRVCIAGKIVGWWQFLGELQRLLWLGLILHLMICMNNMYWGKPN